MALCIRLALALILTLQKIELLNCFRNNSLNIGPKERGGKYMLSGFAFKGIDVAATEISKNYINKLSLTRNSINTSKQLVL